MKNHTAVLARSGSSHLTSVHVLSCQTVSYMCANYPIKTETTSLETYSTLISIHRHPTDLFKASRPPSWLALKQGSSGLIPLPVRMKPKCKPIPMLHCLCIFVVEETKSRRYEAVTTLYLLSLG